MSEPKPQVGDWIRFRRAGLLVIGVVAYVIEARYFHHGKWEVVTDLGDISETDTLEVRGPSR